VAAQLRAGIAVIGNGETARESFFTYVRERLSGFADRSRRPVMADRLVFPSFVELKRSASSHADRVSAMSAPACCGPVANLGPDALRAELDLFDRALAQTGASARPAAATFVTAASPGIVAAAMDNRYYPDDTAYVAAVAEALTPEYRAIVERGHVLQIDAPDLAMERHTRFADRPLADFQAFVATVVAAINRAVEGLDRTRLRLHVCWGNYDGPHHLDVELSAILPLLAEAQVGSLVLPFANPRHAHEHRLLGSLPDAMGVVAGVIETTHNYIEHPEVVADRLVRIADSLGGEADRLQAGTDCGFATFAGYGDVAADIVWEKLRSLVAGAALADERLSSGG
jgi:5-methyltetrahydropteroyltriglutamate--homocysteine methyltransferase